MNPAIGAAILAAMLSPGTRLQDSPPGRAGSVRLEELIERARSAAAKRAGKTLLFEAEYRLVNRGLVSGWGRYRCWGGREFRIDYEMPTGPWTMRTSLDSDAERVLVRMRQLDVKDGDEAIIAERYQRLAWKRAAEGSQRMLMGLLLLHVSDPAALLELARRRYADLKVFGTARGLGGEKVFVLEAILPPHEVPEEYRRFGLARVRIHIGCEDLLLRRHEILDREGATFQMNQLRRYRLALPRGKRPAALAPPAGVRVFDLLPPLKR